MVTGKLDKEEQDEYEVEKTAVKNAYLRQVSEAETYKLNRAIFGFSGTNQSISSSISNTQYAVGSYTGTPSVNSSGDMTWPAKGVITTGWTNKHVGLDIAAAKGTPVCAAADGMVSLIKDIVNAKTGAYESYGKYIKIDHGNGIQTLYAHLIDNSSYVSEGENVSKGQQIGKMGNLGNVRSLNGGDGTHLHFEVQKDGRPINPWNFLGGK